MNLLDTARVYTGQTKILVAVDCIVFGFDGQQLKLLLFKRKVEPLKGQWSLIGAFIKEDMSLDDSAKQILLESTGLSNVFLEELKTYGAVERDPGERVISIAYYSLTRLNELDLDSVEEYDAHWFGLDEIPELILDHGEMVQLAIKRLREKVRRQPIGFNLLGERFTLPQMQILYESILQKELDPRNFRKKMLSFDILTKTREKDKSASKKGAFYYVFNKEKFDEFVANGYNFEI
ncbi:NUDIX domain-containing protein [Robiginitalea sp. M366]|uniref:NUDIX hydrolase n=1 Tax=Robiginitalea aestuariiviva TaxID=3036903 RepID=UPI00240D965F|nr:NUDIX domain-containing protein [Robiginitalea aestuariiviva]MDG1573279.1 NUDIX domain-containing protein [Robiginitalea aestuariiviva]